MLWDNGFEPLATGRNTLLHKGFHVNHIRRWLIEPEYTARLHIWSGSLWFLIGTPVTLLWLSNSVAFVAWMSLYAIVIGHWSSFQAAMAEKRIKKNESS